MKPKPELSGLEIAVIGMAGRFPGANDIEAFWDNLKNGIESVSFFSDEELLEAGIDKGLIDNPDYVKAKRNIEGKEYFDSSFFGYLPDETRIMDPQIRIFHQCVWEALENAGYNPFSYPGLIGLYAGASPNFDWEAYAAVSMGGSSIDGLSAFLLKSSNFTATRIAYKLNLKGPAVFVQSACSTSLVAIHMACRSLLTGENKIALAGGVTITDISKEGYLYQRGMIFSPDGHCRAFDAEARGSVGGEGAAVVVLKKLKNATADRDNVWAVIKGSSLNNDGFRKMGFTTPSVDGQAEVIRSALKMARIEPRSISYIEAHGTGTPIGDPVEVEALTQVFGKGKDKYCALGSVKTNVGHLDTAAGVTGFIKVVLALKHRQIPPSIHFNSPNPEIDFENSPFYVNTVLKEWKNNDYPLRAGISAFGIGGTNAHVILEEAPEPEPSSASREYQLFLLSAKTSSALERMTANLRNFFGRNEKINPADASYTFQMGRGVFSHRRMFVCKGIREVVDVLSSPGLEGVKTFTANKENKFIVFMFPGLGSQYVDMGVDLYRAESVFREELDRCFDILRPIVGCDLKEVLYSSASTREPEELYRLGIAHPLIFSFEYALARLIMTWGIKPDAMIGYSFGEYVAACLAGVFSLEDGLKLSSLRGRLMKDLPAGAMVSVPLPEEELAPLLDDELSLAIANDPSCIVAGPEEAVEAFERQLKARKLLCMRVGVTYAVHSALMEPILREFEKKVGEVPLCQPQIPYISNVSGTWITDEEAVSAKYWCTHMRSTVRFARGLQELLKEKNAIFVEIGPGKALSNSVRQQPGKKAGHLVVNLIKDKNEKGSDCYYLLDRIGRLWLYGLEIDWRQFYSNEKRRKFPLPTYPFEKIEYPLGMKVSKMISGMIGIQTLARKPDIADWFYIPAWKSSLLIPGEQEGRGCCNLVFAENRDLSTRLSGKLEQNAETCIIVRAGEDYDEVSGRSFIINPDAREDYEKLFRRLCADGNVPDRIIHMWNISGNQPGPLTVETTRNRQRTGFYSLLNIARAMDKHGILEDKKLVVITDGLQKVVGTEKISPGKSTILGPVMVISQEYPSVFCCSIDIDLPGEKADSLPVDKLYDEIRYNGTDKRVAYRNGQRWVQCFEALRLEKRENPGRKFRKNGVYLITGGLGEAGYVFAKYLIERFNAKVILTGRTFLPPEAEWEERLSKHDPGDIISDRIVKLKKLQGLHAADARVLYLPGDVSDRETIKNIIQKGEEIFGNLNGVIHTAGVTGGKSFSPINLISKADCEIQFEPKVYGLIGLKEALEGKKIDFCFLTSSISAVLGGLTFSAYASANIFMDYYAASINQNGSTSTHWLSVDLDGLNFKETAGNDSREMNFTLNPEEGIEVLCRLLDSGNISQVILSTADLQARIDKWVTPGTGTEKEKGEPEGAKTKVERPQLLTEYVVPASETEKALVEMWQNFFGIDRIGTNDDFFELGGDSLKAMTICGEIYKHLNVEIILRDFFSRSTVKRLAELIDSSTKKEFVFIKQVEEREYYVLSSAQKRLHFIQQMDPGNTAYNMPQFIHLGEDVDFERLEGVFRQLIQRHESFRTSFEMVDQEPVQKIYPGDEAVFEIEDYEIKEKENIQSAFIRPFDLRKAPLLRVGLVRTGESGYLLIVDMHHIISDGVSMNILQKEFTVLYAGEQLPAQTLQYKDYAEWQNSEEQKAAVKKQEEYWLSRLEGELPVLELPVDYPRPLMQSFTGNIVFFGLGKEKARRLQNMANQLDVTFYILLLSVFNVLLFKLSGQEDIVVGTPIAGRSHADIQTIIGMFVNTLVMRNYPSGDKCFADFLKDVRDYTIAAYENQDYQFEELVEKVKVNRDTGRNPVFDVVFNLLNQGEFQGEIPVVDLEKPLHHRPTTSKFDLNLTALEVEGGLIFSFEYCTALFKPGSIERIIRYLERILSIVVENPRVRLSGIEILDEKEKQQLLIEFNQTTADYPKGKTLHQLFEEQVEKRPDGTALVYMEYPACSIEQRVGAGAGGKHSRSIKDRPDTVVKHLTYRELDEKSNQLAHYLQSKGVESDIIVGLKMERSIEMIIGILGILKAGGAYLPIDVDYPEERIRYMLADSNAVLLLTGRELSDICRGTAWGAAHPAHKGAPTDLAYIIYTSGTTGRPKGTLTTHYNAVRVVKNTNYIDIMKNDRVLQLSNYAFDGSVFDIYGALLNGAGLVMVKEEDVLSADKLAECLEKQGITVFFVTTALFNTLVEEKIHCFDRVRKVLFGGEKVSINHSRKALEHLGKDKITHVYGPTETTVYATFYPIEKIEENPITIPIGKPIANTRVYVLDRYLKPVPVMGYGELYIGGDGVARGYLNNSQLTAEQFIHVSLAADKQVTLYKTGDLVRCLPDGNIEFVGRIDHQVKIRGFRIELSEIESHLLSHEKIKEVVVAVKERIYEGSSREKYLCAYLVSAEEIDNTELRVFLSQSLPDFMIPSYFVQIEKIPLTANGKVDRKRLPEPEIAAGSDYVGPRDEVEERMVEMWSGVLGIEKEKIGVTADFFELGGHSLKATTLLARLHKVFNIDVPLEMIFRKPTIRGLAEYISGAAKAPFISIQAVEKKEYYELSSAQKRLFVIQQMGNDSVGYNVPLAIALEGELAGEHLEGIIGKLIKRHESLRTSFVMIDREPMQRVHEYVEFKIEYYDLATEVTENTGKEKKREGEEIHHFVRAFDLSKAPLLRVGLFQMEKQEHVLILDMHHIITDGSSLPVLSKEFMDLYAGNELKPLRIQYKDYTRWQKDQKEKERLKNQEAYWFNVFKADVPALNLPIDYPRPAVQSFEGHQIGFTLDKENTKQLRDLGPAYGVTLYMVLLAIFNVLLAKLSGQEDIVVGAPTAGRRHAELEPIIGMFVNTLALRNSPAPEKTFDDFLKEVKEKTLEAFENQEYQFEDLVEQVPVNRDAGRNPLFDVMFVLQNVEHPVVKIPGLELRPYEYEMNISKFDLSLTGAEGEKNLLFSFDYCTKLFKKETIERFMGHFNNVLSGIVKDPGKKLADIEIISEIEKNRVLYDFNNTETAYPGDKTIHELFEEQAIRTPDHVAVGAQGTVPLPGDHVSISYNELNEKSNHLAHRLQEKGVQTDTIVGIMAERSIEMIIGILGILRAGGAYLPVDPEYPEERTNYMLTDSNAALLLTACELLDVCRGTAWGAAHPAHKGAPTNLAYIIYTSGSTGRPKGVMVEQQNVVRLVKNTDYIKFKESDRLLQTGALEFDASTFEIWGSLLNGLSLYLASKEEILTAESLKGVIRKYDIGTIWLTSPLFNQLSSVDVEIFAGLRNLLVGGDVLSPVHINRVRSWFPGLNIINGYGPTENTTFSTTFSITKDYTERIPIGKPIANSTAYIIDRWNKLVPVGVVGELCVGGDGVARGYLNNPESTAEKFNDLSEQASLFPTPYSPTHPLTHSTIYRTGDLARWLEDGNIEFLGRLDFQVKVRGFRIELGEIETCLVKHPDVKEAVVIAKENEAGEKYLCAYMVFADGSSFKEKDISTAAADLKKHLTRSMPDYMNPSYFMQIEEIPLTPNGKVDFNALPAVEIESGTGFTAPRDEVEEKLVDIWAKVLRIEKEKIGITANFFELGGHSLGAVVMLSKIHKEFIVKIPVTEIFQTPTIQELSEYIRNARQERFTSIEPAEEKEYYDLSSAQKRLYIQHHIQKNNLSYNIPNVMMLEGNLEKEKVEQAFREVIGRHENLRTSFEMTEEQPIQKIHNLVDFAVEYHERSEDEAKELVNTLVKPFDLSKVPLLRVKLVKVGTARHVLMCDMHHIIMDGTSMGILMREFMAFYAGEEQPPMRIQYKDFSRWQDKEVKREVIKKQEEYWLKQFEDKVPALNLPIDYERPEIQRSTGDYIESYLGAEETKQLKQMAIEEGTTLYMVLLAIFNVALSKECDQEDILVGVPIAGRRHADLQPIIGFFINMLSVRNFPNGEKTFREFLSEVKRKTLNAYDNQDYQFEDLVEKILTARTSARNSLIDVVFVFQNMTVMGGEIPEVTIPELKLKPYDQKITASPFDLVLNGAEAGDIISLGFQYKTDLFKKETIQTMTRDFKEVVSSVLADKHIKLKDIRLSYDLLSVNPEHIEEIGGDFDFLNE